MITSVSCYRLAGDGRGVIEVDECELIDGVLTATGSGVLPEATLWIDCCEGERLLKRHFCTASAGGPTRGRWQFEIHIPELSNRVVLRPMSMTDDETSAGSDAVCLSLG